MSYHSLWGLGYSPNKHFAFVYTKALLAEYVFEKSRMAYLKIVISFLISHTMSKLCLWLSTLPDAACWGYSPIPY